MGTVPSLCQYRPKHQIAKLTSQMCIFISNFLCSVVDKTIRIRISHINSFDLVKNREAIKNTFYQNRTNASCLFLLLL